MKIISGVTINEAYRRLIAELERADHVGNTREIQNCIIEVSKPTITDLHFYKRPFSEKYCDGELTWYWTANNSCAFIGQYAKKWLNISDDGITNNSAYGYILFKKYKNQLEEVIKLLRQDPDTRRAVLNISDPTIDKINTKDMQCTVCLQFLVRNGRLNTTVFMRSNDVFYGFPYDYVFFMTVAKYIAARLQMAVGTYTHHATSMHLYDDTMPKMIESDQHITIPTTKYFTLYYEEVLNEK